MSFWLNTKTLGTAGIRFIANTLTNTQLLQKGYAKSTFVIDEKIADWVHITAKPTGIEELLAIAGTEVTEIKLANIQVIDAQIECDAFFNYSAQYELNSSKLAGKKVVFVGDSQMTTNISGKALAENGAMIYHFQDGGRALKYRTGQGNPDGNWLYHWSRLQVLKQIQGDIFVLHCSTNDDSGGGTLSASAIQTVLDNYPNINDTEASVTSKLASFNSMSEATKVATFNFKAVYGALITQILAYNPKARFILCSIPISRGTYSTASDIRNNRVSIYTSIRNDINEVAEYFNCMFLDTYKFSGVNPENATYYESDGTHWTTEIGDRIGMLDVRELLKLI